MGQACDADGGGSCLVRVNVGPPRPMRQLGAVQCWVDECVDVDLHLRAQRLIERVLIAREPHPRGEVRVEGVRHLRGAPSAAAPTHGPRGVDPALRDAEEGAVPGEASWHLLEFPEDAQHLAVERKILPYSCWKCIEQQRDHWRQ